MDKTIEQKVKELLYWVQESNDSIKKSIEDSNDLTDPLLNEGRLIENNMIQDWILEILYK